MHCNWYRLSVDMHIMGTLRPDRLIDQFPVNILLSGGVAANWNTIRLEWNWSKLSAYMHLSMNKDFFVRLRIMSVILSKGSGNFWVYFCGCITKPVTKKYFGCHSFQSYYTPSEQQDRTPVAQPGTPLVYEGKVWSCDQTWLPAGNNFLHTVTK